MKTLATCSGAEWTWWLTVPYPTVNFGFSECQAVSCYYCLIFAIVFLTGSVTLGSCCPSFRCQPIRSTNRAGKLNSKLEKATINLSNIRIPLSTYITSNTLVKLNGIDASKYCVILILCQFPVFFRYVIGRSSWIRPRRWIMRIGKGDPRKSRNILGGWPKRGLCRVSGMAKFSVRRYSDPYYVIALKEAIVKISAQKQCPNEERIVRSVLQEFDWSKSEIIKQLKCAVKDGLILQVTTFSSHGSTKGIPQTAYRIQRKDGEDDVSMKFDLCANTSSFPTRQITSCAIFHGF